MPRVSCSYLLAFATVQSCISRSLRALGARLEADEVGEDVAMQHGRGREEAAEHCADNAAREDVLENACVQSQKSAAAKGDTRERARARTEGGRTCPVR